MLLAYMYVVTHRKLLLYHHIRLSHISAQRITEIVLKTLRHIIPSANAFSSTRLMRFLLLRSRLRRRGRRRLKSCLFLPLYWRRWCAGLESEWRSIQTWVGFFVGKEALGKLPASGSLADELTRLVAEWFPALVDVSINASAGASPRSKSRYQACYIGDTGLVAIGEGCKLLNNLNLRFVEGTMDEGLIGLIKNCGQSLVSLGVATCAWMTDASLHVVGCHCPNLEVLSVESEHGKNEGVISIAKGCRLLKTLKLQCIGVSDEALEAIGSFCTFLESFSLTDS